MRIIITFTVICFALVLAGCSDQPTSPDLNQKITKTDEVPTDIQMLLESNTPQDLAAGSPDGWPWGDDNPFELLGHRDAYAVTFIWGNFFGPPMENEIITDWSGTLSLDCDAIVHVWRTIDFEPGEDSLLITEDPSYTMWVSRTSCDIDGLSFLVFPRQNVVSVTTPVLTFETGPITLQFTLAQLVKLDALYRLSNGNAVAVHARKIWPHHCPVGFMRGLWIKENNAGSHGRFEGLWLNHKAEPTGVINGTFWTNNDGTRELSGWVSGYYMTVIIAELKGTWWYDDPRMCPAPECGTGHGWFHGHFAYVGPDNGEHGIFKAEFGNFTSSGVDALSLPYRGVWRLHCSYNSNDIGPNIVDDPDH